MADKLLKPRDKSWIKSFYSFIAIDAFLLNKKTEGMRVWAYSCLGGAQYGLPEQAN
jgi:hypothetical protein